MAYEVSTDGGAIWSSTTARQSSLADGDYQFRAIVTDPAGNSSTSNAIEVMVDNTAPAAGTLAFASLDDTGSSDTPPVTKDGTFDLSLSGHSEANGVTVAYEVSTDGGSHLVEHDRDPEQPGRRRLPVPRGRHRPGRQQRDQQSIEVMVDNTAPAAGTLSFASLDDTGSSDTPPVTQDSTFDLSLAGQEAKARRWPMRFRPTAAPWSSTTASQSSLADGDYQFRAVVTDPAGNSATSNHHEVVVDNAAPAAGTLALRTWTTPAAATRRR